MTYYGGNSVCENGKRNADSLIIYGVFALASAMLMKSLYDIVGEIAYLYGDAVFGFSGFYRKLFVAAAVSLIAFTVFAVACRLVEKKLIKSSSLIPILAVMSLTYFGKTEAVLERFLNIGAESRESVHSIHNGLIYLSFAVTILLTLVSVISFYKMKRDESDRDFVPACLFGVLSIVLNVFLYISVRSELSASVEARILFILSAAVDAVKLALLIAVLTNGREFIGSKSFTAASFAVLAVGLFFSVYDSGFVPFDFLRRIDSNFFFG